MKTYKIKESISIPYFDHDDKSLIQTIKNSSKRRNINPILFSLRKLKNILLYKIAYNSSLNKVRIICNRLRGNIIGEHVYIGQHCTIDNAYPEYIYIEDNVGIAGNVTIIAHANPYKHFSPILSSSVSPIIIKKGSWIGAGAIILMGVTIGENAIISAGTIVDKDVPAYSIAKGNPMKIVTEFKELMNN